MRNAKVEDFRDILTSWTSMSMVQKIRTEPRKYFFERVTSNEQSQYRLHHCRISTCNVENVLVKAFKSFEFLHRKVCKLLCSSRGVHGVMQLIV